MNRLATLKNKPGLRRIFGASVDIIAAVVLVAMTLHVVVNALFRSLANRPIQNSLEYVQYWYVPLIAMLGFISAQLRGRHIVADLIYQALPPSLKRGVAIVTQSACAITMVGFSWGTWSYALHSFDIGQTAGLADIPIWPVHFLLPVTFLILSIDFATEVVALLRGGTSRQVDSGSEYDTVSLAGIEGGPVEYRTGRHT